VPKIKFAPLVYFVQATDGGPIKIGKSNVVQLRDRVASLQIANPAELRVLACIAGDHRTEHQLHVALSAYRVRGEWFEDNEVVRRTMDQLVREHGIEALQ
jgi:hypothetical protein